MSSTAIRAGAAFVEILIKDPTVAASLEEVKAKLRTFGQAVDSVGSQSFVPMQAVAAGALVSTGASVGVLAATMGVLRAGIVLVGNAFRVTFNMITASVTRAVIGIGAIAFAVARLAPKGGRLAGLLDGFMTRSQTTEAVGRWTRFLGLLSGSQTLRGIGNQIERLGLGSAVVEGFRKGGLSGGIGATFGAMFRSSKSIVASGLVGLFTGPIGVVRGLLGRAFSVGGGAGGGVAGALGGISGPSGAIAGNLNRATASARTFGATATLFTNVSAAVRGLALRVAGLAAAITGPALLAAKKFVTSSEEILAASKETGDKLVSIQDGIRKKFGDNSLISESDIAAGAALGKVMTELKQATAAAWAQIGAAALPVLRGLTENMLWAANATTQLLGRNRELVQTVIRVAAQVGSAAAAGLALYAVFPYLVAGVGMILSPLGLFAAGVIAVAIAFPQLLTEARSVFGFLTANFTELGQIVTTTMGGIADALAGGNLQLAARVLFAGLNVAWLAGTEQLRAVWRNMQTGLAEMWINFGASIQRIWANVMSGFLGTWKTVQNAFAGGFARVIARFTGQDVNEVLATLTEMQDAEAAGVDAAFKKRLDGIEAARQATLESLDEEAAARNAQADQQLEAARAELIAARAAAAVKPVKGPDVSTEKAALAGSTSLGSFSAASLGQNQNAGFGKLEDYTRRTALATETLAGRPAGRPAFS